MKNTRSNELFDAGGSQVEAGGLETPPHCPGGEDPLESTFAGKSDHVFEVVIEIADTVQ